MTIGRIGVATVLLAFGWACTGGLPAELPAPSPEPPTDAPAVKPGKGGKGKAGKRGKRRDVPGCPEGMIAAPSWPGEYPGPVIDVVKAVTVKVRTEPCAAATLDCSVPPGLYHPWSELEAEYLTVRTIDKWKVLKDLDEDELHAKAGDIVEVYQSFGEGYCGYRVAGKDVTAQCPELLGEALEKVPGKEVPEKQLFSVTCDGKTGWVEASTELLALPEVREGTIPEYGTVGPGKD